jgi:predicted Zn-dependent peptidase
MRKNYVFADFLTDIFCRGESSRLYQELVKTKKLFSSIHFFNFGNIDPSLIFLEGKLIKGVDINKAEKAIWEEFEKLKNQKLSDYEVNKTKNLIESAYVSELISLSERATNLAYFEIAGDANIINTKIDDYLKVLPQQIQDSAKTILVRENCSTLYYLHDATTKN